jgi:hypothetical protein
MPAITVHTDGIAVEPLPAGTFTVTSLAGSTLYYADNVNVSATNNQGSLTAGQNATFIVGQWLKSARSTDINITYNVAVSSTAVDADVGSVLWAKGQIFADGVHDDWAALQAFITTSAANVSQGNGVKIMLPPGNIQLSKTLVIPSYCLLQGQGLYSTALRLTPNANCDVVQMETYNSSYQAGLLGVGAGSLLNAFRSGIADLCIHGMSPTQTYGTYTHGLNVTTSPLTVTGPGDPDFDVEHTFRNLYIRSCTGDGYYHAGRSGVRLVGCFAEYNYGNGFTLSFDTQLDHCQSGFNGICGFYFNHQSGQGAGNKSYNNGFFRWVSGSNYSAGNGVIYSGVQYIAKNALTNDTVIPPSDPTNWVATASTSPQAFGTGVYCDANAGEITFNCDSQQDSADSFYVRSNTGAIHLTGTSHQPNFNNDTGLGNNATNPNNYSTLTLDNSSGVIADLGANSMAPAAYLLRVINGSSANDVRMGSDSSASASLAPTSVGMAANRITIGGRTLYAPTPGPFPNTAVLDNFTRAAENPLSDAAAWAATGILGAVVLKTNGTQALSTAATGTTAGQGWNTSFTLPTEIYVTVAVLPAGGDAMDLYWLSSPTSATANGYDFGVFGNGTWAIYKITAGGFTTLVSGAMTLAAGDTLGMSINTSGLITAWHKSGAAWAVAGQIVDTTYTGASYVGMDTNDANTRFANFGGGHATAYL